MPRAALMRLQAEAAKIEWKPAESGSGGIMHNLNEPLASAAAALESQAPDALKLRAALLATVHALKALILKADGNAPSKYRGDR